MTGSEKQIKWAEDIREKMLAKLKQKMSANTLPPELPDRDDIFQLMCRQCGQAVFLIEKTDEAVWFIENREAVDSVESILSALEIEQHD